MRRTWTLVLAIGLTAAQAEPVSGRFTAPGAPTLQLVDGWAANDSTPRFLNVFLVPYPCPKHMLESGKPYAQVCAWFPQQPDLKTIQMATFTIYGLGGEREYKYSFNDSTQARLFLRQLQVKGKRWSFSSAMQGVKSPYPGVPSGSWSWDVDVLAPTSR